MSGRFHVGDNINMFGGSNNTGVQYGPSAPETSREARTGSRVVWGEPFVFINYRNTDEKAAADIDAELTRQLGSGAVFRDERMSAGTEFPRELELRAGNCKVMISVIGRKWDDTDGLRLLRDRNDWVRREIATALAHGVKVIPVLVGVRGLLDAEVLPKDIRKIAVLQVEHLPRGYDEEHVRRLVEKLVREVPALAEARNRG